MKNGTKFAVESRLCMRLFMVYSKKIVQIFAAEKVLEVRGSWLDRILTLCILPDFPSSRCYIVERQFHFSLYSLLTLGVTLDLEKIKTLIVTRAFTL